MGLFDSVRRILGGVAAPAAALGGAYLLGGAGALPAGVALAGGLAGQQSINQARGTARDYSEQQQQAIREANERAMAFLQQMYADTEGARGVYSGMATSEPTTLRPAQELALEDLQRRIQHNLSASGTRGTGRGGIDLAFDALSRGRLGMEEQNRAEQRQAARDLTSFGFRVPAEQAALTSRAGTEQAAVLGGTGATLTAADVAGGQQFSDALGAIAGLVSSTTRQQDPSRRYQGLLGGLA